MMHVEKLADDLYAAFKAHLETVVAPLVARIAELEARPLAKDGAPGPRGEKGDPGPAGDRGQKGDDGITVSASQVADAIFDIPGAREMLRGPKGDPGGPGPAGQPGEKGMDGRDGRDGMPGAQGQKGLDGRNGTDGKDGRDGFDLDDFSVTRSGRDLVFAFRRGDTVLENSVRYDVVLDAGVFREGAPYEKGDGVTFGGSWWIAQKDAPQGKPGTSADWRLAVKKGRDGRGTP